MHGAKKQKTICYSRPIFSKFVKILNIYKLRSCKDFDLHSVHKT